MLVARGLPRGARANITGGIMNHRRRGLKVLGLSILAALGLMAFTAAGAQGALFNTGEWLIAGKTLKELKVEKETIFMESEDHDTYFLILKLELIVECLKFSGTGYILPLGHGDVDLFFEECEVLDHKKNKIDCEVEDFWAKLLAQVILHGPDGKELPYILFSALEKSGIIAIIRMFGEECVLPEEAAITGSFVAHVTNPLEDVELQLILVNETSLLLFPEHRLKYGFHEVHLFLNALAHLTGKYVGQPWGIV
jgi:hypothetical protein